MGELFESSSSNRIRLEVSQGSLRPAARRARMQGKGRAGPLPVGMTTPFEREARRQDSRLCGGRVEELVEALEDQDQGEDDHGDGGDPGHEVEEEAVDVFAH
jgi:hypothetical protein